MNLDTINSLNLPKPLKSLAIKRLNAWPAKSKNEGFVWADTPEGYEFWADVRFGRITDVPGVRVTNFRYKPSTVQNARITIAEIRDLRKNLIATTPYQHDCYKTALKIIRNEYI